MLHTNQFRVFKIIEIIIFQQNGMNRHLIGGIIYDKIAM